MSSYRPWLVLMVFVAIWQSVVSLTELPGFMLPRPLAVLQSLGGHASLLAYHAMITLSEIILGLLGGVLIGALSALAIALIPALQPWMLPPLVLGQAIPVFALAPLLVLWFGYGMGSKVAMAMIIIYFPVTAALFDGLRRTERGWLDLAHTMGASRLSQLWHMRLPAALPAFGSGLRIATAFAPIAAVVGEWVGSGAGLGYLMLHANGRMQTDLMFAAMIVLMAIALGLYVAVDRLLVRLTPWAPHTLTSTARM